MTACIILLRADPASGAVGYIITPDAGNSLTHSSYLGTPADLRGRQQLPQAWRRLPAASPCGTVHQLRSCEPGRTSAHRCYPAAILRPIDAQTCKKQFHWMIWLCQLQMSSCCIQPISIGRHHCCSNELSAPLMCSGTWCSSCDWLKSK